MSNKASLLQIHPHIADEWNLELKGQLKPDDVTKGADKKVGWKCARGMLTKRAYPIELVEKDVQSVQVVLNVAKKEKVRLLKYLASRGVDRDSLMLFITYRDMTIENKRKKSHYFFS